MQCVSIVVPLYQGAAHIESTLKSLVEQDYPHLEIIVSDDAGSDNARELVERMQALDSRIVIVGDGVNRGTLGARKCGVAASTGDFLMFVDQDDELAPNAVSHVMSLANEHPSDLYHFPARVIPENAEAQEAAAGMQSFLTPPPRKLIGEDILKTQLSEDGGFDWHLHHKMYRGDLVRKAYSLVPDVRLLQSDDFYLCFVIDALAKTYYALDKPALYDYHLGRGDTFGTARTAETVCTISKNNVQAYRLIRDFATSADAPKRSDWQARLDDAQHCLLLYPLNEWKDALNKSDQTDALPALLADWDADFVCAELWRFSRDTAYELLVYLQEQDSSQRADSAEDDKRLAELKENAWFYRDIALMVEREYHLGDESCQHYHDMRRIATDHLNDVDAHMTNSGVSRSIGMRLRNASKRLLGLSLE